MKKIIILLASFAIFSNSAFAFYDDVSSSHEYYEPISELYQMSLLPEYDDNNFNPDAYLKTTDLYELVFAYGQADLTAPLLPFSNTNDSAFYAPYLQTAIDLRLFTPLRGTSEFNFNKTIAKHAALRTMFKALGVGTNYLYDKDSMPFTDVTKNSINGPVAYKAAEIGILEDNPLSFRAVKRITRAEAASYLHKIFNHTPEGNITINLKSSDSEVVYKDLDNSLDENENFEIFVDIWEKLHEEYLYQDQLDDDEMLKKAIAGMMEAVEDTYTTFQDEEAAKSFLDLLANEYEGIGVSVELIGNNFTIISPFKGSPAEKAGLKPNDIIIAVDGKNIVGQNLYESISQIKGLAGTSTELTIIRGINEFNFTVKREAIVYDNVEVEYIKSNGKKIAYIEIINFGDNTYDRFQGIALESIDDGVDGFIIDLRNNPGGYLNMAIEIASLYTKTSKTIANLKYENGSKTAYKSSADGELADYKTIVLVNEGSASASEILAGALQDHNLATIIGETTFGKGSVQEYKEYDNGTVFKFTTANWLTPEGRVIDKNGIIPDHSITNIGNNDNQLEYALEQF